MRGRRRYPFGRLLVFVDHEFLRDAKGLTAQDAFWLFLRALGSRWDHVRVLGRVAPRPARGPYPLDLGRRLEFVELPHYTSLYAVGQLLLHAPRLLRLSWQALVGVDAVLLGVPHPLAAAIATLARLRGVPRVLLDRQDLLPRVRLRAGGPSRVAALALAHGLVAITARQSRRALTFTVGSHLRPRYERQGGRPRDLLISLVSEADLRETGARSPAPEVDGAAILWVGRVDPDKGLPTLLDALARLARGAAEGGPMLDLVGTGSAVDAVRARAEALGLSARIRWHGYVPFGPDLAAFYRRADLFVLPSNESEGFPQVIFECFAAGLPLIATAVAGIPATLEDGRHALLVPPRDPCALANAVERLLADRALADRLAAAGRAFVTEHTLERQVARFVDAVQEHVDAVR